LAILYNQIEELNTKSKDVTNEFNNESVVFKSNNKKTNKNKK
jgi:hypothetical protein